MIGLSFVKARERIVRADNLDDNDAEEKLNQNQQQQTKEFVRMGRIIPVDQEQKAIKNAPTPHYRRDPADPSKALPTKAPKVNNYKPVKKGQVDNYDADSQMVLPPNDPHQDTKLIYGRTKKKRSPQPTEPNNVEKSTKKTTQSTPNSKVTNNKITESVQKKTRLFGFGRKKKKEKAAKEQELKKQQAAQEQESSSQENTTNNNTNTKQTASGTEPTTATNEAASTTPKLEENKDKAQETKLESDKKSAQKTKEKTSAPKEKTPANNKKEAEPKKKAKPKPKKQNEAKETTPPVVMNKDIKVPPKPLVATLYIVDHDQKDKVLTKLTYEGHPGDAIKFTNLKEVLQIYNYDGYEFSKARNDTNKKDLVAEKEKDIKFGIFGKDDVQFTILMKHRLQKVTPDSNVSGLDKNELYKKVTLTVNFDGAGDKNPDPVVQPVWWTRNGTWDTVSHKLVKGKYDNDWTPAKTHYKEVKVPVIAGYHADRKVIDEQEVTQEDIKLTVGYAPNAYFVPVSPDDEELGHKQQFVTDPNDATVMKEDEQLPVIKGYTALNLNLTPINPDEDLRVTYNPIKQVKTKTEIVTAKQEKKEEVQATVPKASVETKIFKPQVPKPKETKQVSYIIDFAGAGDKTPDSILQLKNWPAAKGQRFDNIKVPIVAGYHTKDDSVKGPEVQDHNIKQTIKYEANGSFIPVDENGKKIGEPQQFITNSSDPTKVLANEALNEIAGYSLEQKQATPLDPGKDQKITYKKIPQYTEVNSKHPNDKVDPEQYTKLVKLTVKFTGAKQNPAPVAQTMRLTRSVTIDQDNKLIEKGKFTTDWKPDKKEYDAVKIPVAPGYHTKESELKGVAAEKQNITRDVHYIANGKLELVNKDGKEIAPAVTYQTDPHDPSRVLDVKVPEVKGYKNETKTVKPDDPATNQKVEYTKLVQYFLVNVDHPNKNVDSKEYNKNVRLVVNFIGGGNDRPKQQVQKAHLTRNLTINDEGKIVPNGKFTTEWHAEPEEYKEITIPVLKNYHTDKKVIPAQAVKDHDLEETVKYDPNGLLFLQDEDGVNIHMPLQFTTDKDDPTKIASLKLPTIDGFKTDLKEVTPDHPGDNATVKYLEVVQETQPAPVKSTEPKPVTKPEPKTEPVSETKTEAASEVKTEPKVETRTEPKVQPKPTQPKVEAVPKTQPKPQRTPVSKVVTPKPAPVQETAAASTTPVKREQNEVVFVQTVQFVDENGRKLKADHEDKLVFRKDAHGEWNKNIDTFGGITAPVIAGYYTDKRLLQGKTVMPDDKELHKEIKLVYHRFGQIIPIDMNGEVIPNPSHDDQTMVKAFANDPRDATKALRNQQVPTIDGWQSSTSTVSPTDPGINIPVIYQKEK